MRCALPAGLVLWLLATPALAQQFSREQDIVDLRLGQRVLVDDGSCPAGQIKEVAGSQMTTSGVCAPGNAFRGWEPSDDRFRPASLTDIIVGPISRHVLTGATSAGSDKTDTTPTR